MSPGISKTYKVNFNLDLCSCFRTSSLLIWIYWKQEEDCGFHYTLKGTVCSRWANSGIKRSPVLLIMIHAYRGSWVSPWEHRQFRGFCHILTSTLKIHVKQLPPIMIAQSVVECHLLNRWFDSSQTRRLVMVGLRVCRLSWSYWHRQSQKSLGHQMKLQCLG